MKRNKFKAVIVVGVLAVLALLPMASAGASGNLLLRHRSSIIYVEDHTGWRWPVYEATHDWNYGTTASVRYGACRAGYGCVRVYEAYLGRNGQVGVTHFVWSGSILVEPVKVVFNDSYFPDAHQRRQTACHELGHGLGIEFHDPYKSSCLYAYATDSASMYPGAWGRYWLNRAY